MQIKIYPGSIVTVLLDSDGADISTAQSPQILCRKPDGTVVTWPATLVDANTLSYTTQETDLDQVGEYRLQALPNLPQGYLRGETAGLEVSENFT